MAAISSSSTTINAVNLTQQATDPAAPSASHWVVYAKSGGVFYEKSDGTVLQVASLTGTETLTNKTLTSPVLTTAVIATGTPTTDKVLGWDDTAKVPNWGDGTANHDGVSTDQTQTLTNKTLTSPVLTTPTVNGSGGALTLPAGPDTLVGRATTDTLTNKTLTTPTLTTPLANGAQLAVASKSANYTAVTTDLFIISSGASTTITLPAASNKGQVVVVKRNDASNNQVVSRAGTDTIEGATTKTLATDKAAVTLVADGTSTWYILATVGTVS